MQIEFKDLEIDENTKYGGWLGAEIILEIEPIYKDNSFTAHGPNGMLQVYNKGLQLTSFNILDSYLIFIDQDGCEYKEYNHGEFDIENYVSNEEIIEKIQEKC